MKKVKYLMMIFLLLSGVKIYSQDLKQTIKGRVTDKQTKVSLPGANVIILYSDPLIGASTDVDGYYYLKKVPAGRLSLQVSFLGYKTKTYDKLDLSSAKEMILDIELEEEIVSAKEVVISATKNKTEVNNSMSTISSRTFTIEETQRFAGARRDVSRMAANYAGVGTSNDATNDIVIRGNSPYGLLWRLEGVDIPNPNHFGGLGASGGPISMLNNNVLANSDFMTGAFAAEYGNALSGVFDLKMRNGNYDKHEFMGDFSFGGVEFGMEGPISRKHKSSYLVNYRYSTLGLMMDMGIDFGTGVALPKYQDLSFKLNFPSNKIGTISIFGLAGTNEIEFKDSDVDSTETDDNFYDSNDYETDAKWENSMGVLGLSHTYLINKNTYTKLSLAMSTRIDKGKMDSLSTKDRKPISFYREKYQNDKIFASFHINKKAGKHHNFRLGVIVDKTNSTMVDSAFNAAEGRFETNIDFEGNMMIIQSFFQWQYKVNNKLTFNSGIHYQHLDLSKKSSIEPRMGLKYKINKRQNISAAYGMHSKSSPTSIYLSQVQLSDGSYFEPNKSLGFTKSHHYVIGYDRSISENMRIKVEAYYQKIFDAIVDVHPGSFSALNFGAYRGDMPDSLNNDGKGHNYGLELTLEKFLSKGYYFLVTTSLFQSKYTGSDGIERNTAFNGNYVFNALAGKEYVLNKGKSNQKRKKILTIDAKITAAGGQRYTPVDIAKTILAGETVYDESKAFSEQFKDYFRADLRVAYRLDGKKFAHEFSLDIQNITNQKNPLYQRYNQNTNELVTINQMGMFPNIGYRILF